VDPLRAAAPDMLRALAPAATLLDDLQVIEVAARVAASHHADATATSLREVASRMRLVANVSAAAIAKAEGR
uniref:hypothetical protein n=1 Tax=Stenotrophomonas maltophilia TaxID=40324 RepID=UPI001953C6A9